ncbi:hypothetical protein SAVCW2_14760 [Streptomyces avermitilis]|nr:hypothetical protein SAVCW2_14760 [Streptomyces avermitilis]
MSLTRRDFARRSALTGAGVALAGSVGALATAPNALASTDTESAGEESADRHGSVGYGPLIPDPKGILALPAGFSYRVITYSGKTKLESGEFTPSNHDGTATFDGPRGATLLVNNHELKGPAPTGSTRSPSPRASSTTRPRPAAARSSRSAATRSPSGSASPAPPPTARAAAPPGAPGSPARRPRTGPARTA